MTHHNGRPALWQKARRTVGHHSGMKRLFLQTYVFAVCIPPETKKIHLQNVRVDQKKERLLWGFILLLFFKSTLPPSLSHSLSPLSLALSRTHLFHRHPQRNNDDANIHTAYCNDSSSSSSVSSSKRCESCQTAKPFLWMAHTSVTTCQTEQATDTALTLSASLGAQSK